MSNGANLDWIEQAVEGAARIDIAPDLGVIHGRIQMIVPVGGSHVRQAWLKFRQTDVPVRPTTIATVYSESSPGNPFSIYNITWVVDRPGWTYCKLSAQADNDDGSAIYCDYAIFVTDRRDDSRSAAEP